MWIAAHLTIARTDAALQRMRELQKSGVNNIDVGCFQINLQHHPSAFTDLNQAFDPTANAQYAARFLTGLRSRLGSWRMQSPRTIPPRLREEFPIVRWCSPTGPLRRAGSARSPLHLHCRQNL